MTGITDFTPDRVGMARVCLEPHSGVGRQAAPGATPAAGTDQ